MAKFITIILAEAAIESFPQDLLKNMEVRKYLQKMKKKHNEIMLDVSYHKNFMKKLPDVAKRGRPDIVHFALLAAFGSIIAREKRLNVFIHTYDDKLIQLNPEVRLPKNFERFNGIFLQLFREKQIPPDSTSPLIKLEEGTLENLLEKLKPLHDVVIEFTVEGENLTSKEYTDIIHSHANPLLIFGAFPHNHLTRLPQSFVDHKIAIYQEGLDLFSVIAQILASVHNREENTISESERKISLR